MTFIYEKGTFASLSFLDFVREPMSFASRPIVFYEATEGLPPPCQPCDHHFSYPDSADTLHQTFRVTPYQMENYQIWLCVSHNIPQAMLREIVAFGRTFPFLKFTSVNSVDTSIFNDLRDVCSFASGLRPHLDGLRTTSPTRTVGLQGGRHTRKPLQTIFAGWSPGTMELPFENDIDEVDESLFIGTEHGARDCALLKKHGVTHIVTLFGNELDGHFPELFEYRRVPLNDSVFEDLTQNFWDAVNFVKEAITEGGKVLLHCRRGISRSPALALAYLIRAKGMDFDEALEQLKQHRPVVDINSGFLEQIRTAAGIIPGVGNQGLIGS